MILLVGALLVSLAVAESPAAHAAPPTTAALDSAAVAPLIAHGSLEQHKTAERTLERVLKRDRDNLAALLLSGRLAVVEGKLDLGRRFYRRAIKIAPDNREAHRELGLLWMREWGRYREAQVLQRAVDELEPSLPPAGTPADSADWIALAMYAALQCERGAPERARVVLAPRIDAGATPWAILALGMAQHGLGQLRDADRSFARGMRAIGPIERAGYTDVRPVASGPEREDFGRLSLEDRAAWLRVFWKSHDPTPTTDVNEFQLEFYRRVTAAFLFYRPPAHKWWDARGDTYVRFGAPDVVDLVDALRDIGEGELITVAVPSEIIWKYPRFRMDIRLSETTLSGSYSFPFATRVNSFRPYMNRGVRDLPAVRNPTTGRINWDPALEQERLVQTRRERRGAELLDRGAFLVPVDFRRRIVAFATTHAAFRSSVLGETRQQVAMGVSPASLDEAGRERLQSRLRAALADTVVWGIATSDSGGVGPEDSVTVLTATAVLFDPAWREVRRVTSHGPFQRINTVDGPMLVAALDLSAPPGHYYLATSMEDSASIGARREGANLPEYPPSLCLSDLQMAADDSALVRGPRVNLPLPLQSLGGDQPLVITFEAYNLSRDIRGQARARVSATIRELPDPGQLRKGVVSRSGGLFGRPRTAGVITTEFSDVVRNSTLARTFAVDVGALDAGDYQVDVVVHDEGTGLEASARTTFTRKYETARRN